MRECRGCGAKLWIDEPGDHDGRHEADCLASKLVEHEKLVSVQQEKLVEVQSKLDRLEQLLATAYQLAGLVGAPVRFLDAYSRHEGDIDSLLPVDLSECDEFTALQSRLDDALDKASRFDRAEVWAQNVEFENAELRSRLDEAVTLLRHWMPESELRLKGFAVEIPDPLASKDHGIARATLEPQTCNHCGCEVPCSCWSTV